MYGCCICVLRGEASIATPHLSPSLKCADPVDFLYAVSWSQHPDFVAPHSFVGLSGFRSLFPSLWLWSFWKVGVNVDSIVFRDALFASAACRILLSWYCSAFDCRRAMLDGPTIRFDSSRVRLSASDSCVLLWSACTGTVQSLSHSQRSQVVRVPVIFVARYGVFDLPPIKREEHML